ncbi:MAG TPA: hypothetical protein VD867_09695 [Burkholderiales bacterium]|nr:hypothetical protein [Burkholderiales bacterium]
MRIIQPILLLIFLALLAGCEQQAAFEKFVPKEEAAAAKVILSRLAAKDYAEVERQMDPSVQAPSVRGSLEQVAALFPAGEPKSVHTVGSYTSTFNALTTYNLTFEHEYSDLWLLTNVVLQRRAGQLTLLRLQANLMKQSLKDTNRFTFEGKGPIHYIVFALAVAIPLFIVYALVLCFRTPIAKRRWLWVLFVALGFVQLSLDWATGAFDIQPLSFALLGAGFFQAGPYAPYLFNVSIPVGAIVFLARRRSLIAQSSG